MASLFHEKFIMAKNTEIFLIISLFEMEKDY